MSSLFDLTGRVAVVVGATSGIGRALALGLADAGADVIATARRESLVDAVAAEIESRGRRTLRVAADVADAASLTRLRDACLEQFGAIDILLYASGITKRVETLSMSETDWQQIMDVNVNGAFRTIQIFGPPMLARGRGRVIMVGSLASFIGLFEVAAYTTSKSAIAG